MNRPIVFLDIDGVLNTPNTPGFQTPQGKIEPALVQNLNLIAGAFENGIDIVISSHWRVWHSLDSIMDMLHDAGLSYAKAFVIDKTPDTGPTRGNEIAAWLEKNCDPVTPWCIIDDNPWMLKSQKSRFVMTDSEKGLTWDKAKDVIKVLSS
jgi:hypothetical protein